MTLPEGYLLGRYRIERRLGGGGMGDVYRASDTRLQRAVAIKVLTGLLADSPEFLQRFEREARAVAALAHPNIIVLHDFGHDAGMAFAVLELLEGESLATRLERGTMPAAEAVHLALQVARGLAEAHARGVVHRDLKPENVFLTASGLVKILDFGLATFGEAAAPAQPPPAKLTAPGTVMGSPLYMSPEQVRGEDVGPAADVFAFGTLLHELLTGRHPFSQANTWDTMAAVLRDAPSIAFDSTADHELLRLVERCLRKTPGERPPTADVVTALEAADGGRPVALRPSPRADPTGDQPVSVAVLPFVDMSAAHDQRYFCEGMAEELITALSRLPGLRVAARTSTFQFAGTGAGVRELAAKLSVTRVLEGSVRIAGSQLRVGATLVDAERGFQVWSETYHREMTDVFQVQDEIAASVATALRDHLGSGAMRATLQPRQRGRASTSDVETYRHYLLARYHRYSLDDFAGALDLYRQVVEQDSGHALARAGVAESAMLAGNGGILPLPEAYAVAAEQIVAALALDPACGDAVCAGGVYAFLHDRDWAVAEPRLRRAVDLAPASVQARAWLSLMLSARGRQDEALTAVERCRQIDPLSPYAGAMIGLVRLHGGDIAGAVAEFDRALELDPGYLFALGWQGVALASSGRLDRARELLERCTAKTHATFHLALLGWVHALAGDENHARAILAECRGRIARDGTPAIGLVWLAAALGEANMAWELFSQADAARLDMTTFPHFTGYAPLRSDPRFTARFGPTA